MNWKTTETTAKPDNVVIFKRCYAYTQDNFLSKATHQIAFGDGGANDRDWETPLVFNSHTEAAEYGNAYVKKIYDMDENEWRAMSMLDTRVSHLKDLSNSTITCDEADKVEGHDALLIESDPVTPLLVTELWGLNEKAKDLAKEGAGVDDLLDGVVAFKYHIGRCAGVADAWGEENAVIADIIGKLDELDGSFSTGPDSEILEDWVFRTTRLLTLAEKELKQ